MEKPKITRQKRCVNTWELKEVYYFCTNGYGEHIKINNKYVIFKHKKTLLSPMCTSHPLDIDRGVKEKGFVDGLCDIGDYIVVQNTNTVKKLCQI